MDANAVPGCHATIARAGREVNASARNNGALVPVVLAGFDAAGGLDKTPQGKLLACSAA